MAQNDQNTGLQLHIPGMGQFKNLEFVQSETNPADLIVKLPDGSEIVFPDYIPLAEAGVPPAITLDDGTVVPGQEIVSLIDNLDYSLIAPAAGNDVVGPETGGGAEFSADPSGPLGDDIGHGPYAGGVHIADNVEFTQVPGYVDDGSGGSGELAEMTIMDNLGDTYFFMDYKTISYGTSGDTYNRPVDPGDFRIVLETEAPSWNDWDGIHVELYAGETITITPDQNYVGQYYIALGTDANPATGTNPLATAFPVGWEYFTTDGVISYTVTGNTSVYIGTGFEGGVSPETSYFTDILVESGNGELTGSGGDDILVGGNGDDVLTGGAGDDLLAGGAGDDQYMYTDASTDGQDTIVGFDYNAGPGDNDVINLDVLFDALSIAPAGREVLVNDVGADAVLTIGDGTHTNTALVAAAGFSVTLDGMGGLGLTEAQLITNGNLVES